MITNTKQNIEKYFPNEKRDECIKFFKSGFLDGWKKIKSSTSLLDMFYTNEFKLLCKKANEDQNEIVKEFFA